MSGRRFYFFLFSACITGYAWLFYCIDRGLRDQFRLCLFKRITSIACPSCGTTRSVMLLFQGNITDSFFINPFGWVIATIMLAAPFWILTDLIRQSYSLLNAYRAIEHWLQKRWPAIIFVSIVIMNWIWNIYKGL